MQDIVGSFVEKDNIDKIQLISGGNINKTYKVVLKQYSFSNRIVIQKINTEIFKNPHNLISNFELISNHIKYKISSKPSCLEGRQWTTPIIIKPKDENYSFLNSGDSFWRAMTCIYPSRSYNKVLNRSHAYEIGNSLGIFHLLLSDFDSKKLLPTIPDLHKLDKYLHNLSLMKDDTDYWKKFSLDEVKVIDNMFEFIDLRKEKYTLFLHSLSKIGVSKSIIHGDSKIDNILFDCTSDKVISFIDLDTVSNDYTLYDVCDCLRSICNLEGEDSLAFSRINFDLSFFEAMFKGYTKSARSILTKQDYYFLVTFLSSICFELGVRFFLDFIMGNNYFHVSYPLQNLNKAKVQFALLKSIEIQSEQINTISNSLHH